MKARRVNLSRTALPWLVAAMVVLGLVAAAPAATFRHPELGYTVWYPDGWTVHSPPELIEPVAPPMDIFRAFALDVLVQKRTVKERPGLFVASSCGPKAYLGDGKILPEDHSELAIWREAEDKPCTTVVKDLLSSGRLALGSSLKEGDAPVTGGTIPVVGGWAKPYWQWAILYMLACKEVGKSRFVLRFAAAGPGVDVKQVLQNIGRAYDSLQFPGGRP
ncbi:MAG: hypothetical protein KatS3mg077_1546 [Candidatus Binatia bacterium]|nr:MAG: hypothetical protein KatS3mg077_1536 [Candidatus Binatia bacterium]GIW44264.1 MAG: hypothetical protein KatS3mg077_1546 [Candidatus Binatia bacterium]